MFKKKIIALVAVLGTVAVSYVRADTITDVTSRAALGANDLALWPSHSGIVSNLTVQSANGLSVTASQTPPDTFQALTASDDNFALGDDILTTDDNPAPLTIKFSSPVSAAGFQIASNAAGDFNAAIDAFDSKGNLLGSFTESGDNTFLPNSSAIFIGLKDVTAADIASLTIVTSEASTTELGLQINQVSLVDAAVTAVPEPAALFLFGCGFISVAAALRKQARAF
jgi:hypothetical protein